MNSKLDLVVEEVILRECLIDFVNNQGDYPAGTIRLGGKDANDREVRFAKRCYNKCENDRKAQLVWTQVFQQDTELVKIEEEFIDSDD